MRRSELMDSNRRPIPERARNPGKTHDFALQRGPVIRFHSDVLRRSYGKSRCLLVKKPRSTVLVYT